MASEYGNEIRVGGQETQVAALYSRIFSDAPEWFEGGLLHPLGDGKEFEAIFPSRGGPAFDDISAITKEYSGLVIAVASVELANGFAEARVFVGGGCEMHYTMPDDEIAACEDEGEVFGGLMSTVDSPFCDEIARTSVQPAP